MSRVAGVRLEMLNIHVPRDYMMAGKELAAGSLPLGRRWTEIHREVSRARAEAARSAAENGRFE